MKCNRTKLLGLLLILILCFIWGNSMLPASYSSAFRQWVKDSINALLGGVDSDVAITSHSTLRKIAHATEFAALGVVLAGFLNWDFKRNYKLFLLGGVVVAFFDETIQLFVEGRSSQVSDIWIDLSGFFLGGLLAFLIGYLVAFKRKKNIKNKNDGNQGL